jgi:predicted metal-dependent hydrolase
MQNRTIFIDGNTVEYTLKKRRGQRSYTLSVHAGGRVTLTVPKVTSVSSAEHFLQQKIEWLKNAIQQSPKCDLENKTERKEHYKKYKEQARKMITKRLTEINAYYGYEYGRISVRLNSSRWGSCSEAGTLNFDYRILFLEPHLQDYLLVHELCHLRQMNHSKNFWALVEKYVPNYKDVRKELRRKKL